METIESNGENPIVTNNSTNLLESKVCITCKINKPICDFHFRKKKYYERSCKECGKPAQRRWNVTRYYKDKAKGAVLARNRIWEAKNKEKRRDQKRKYRKENRERVLAHRRARYKYLMTNNPAHRVLETTRQRIHGFLKDNKTHKTKKTQELLGCTREELKEYIESKFYNGMTWDKWGKGPGKFQIDHILPLASFDMLKGEDQLKAFHYTNLQPLWHEDHVRKTSEDIAYINSKKKLNASNETKMGS